MREEGDGAKKGTKKGGTEETEKRRSILLGGKN